MYTSVSLFCTFNFQYKIGSSIENPLLLLWLWLIQWYIAGNSLVHTYFINSKDNDDDAGDDDDDADDDDD